MQANFQLYIVKEKDGLGTVDVDGRLTLKCVVKRKNGERCGLDLSGLGKRGMENCRGEDERASGCIKCGEFLDWMCYCACTGSCFLIAQQW